VKSGIPLISIVFVSLGLIIWVVVFRLGGIPGITTPPPPAAATAEPAPEPKPERKPVKKVVAKAAESAPPPVAETAPAVKPPAPPELPMPTLNDVPLGSSGRDLLADFHAPALQGTSIVGGQLHETYVYSPGERGRDTWVLLKDGRVTAKFAFAHDQ